MPELWLSRLAPMRATGIRHTIARRAEQAGIGHVHGHQQAR